MSLAGRCCCGRSRYRLLDTPLFTHCCHCGHCQRESGSGFAINILIETAKLEYNASDIRYTEIPTASGKGQTLARCSNCEVVLWSHYAGAGQQMAFVRAGTLDEPAAVKPDIHIFTESALPWLPPEDGVARVPRYYNADKYWPAASLNRRKTLV